MNSSTSNSDISNSETRPPSSWRFLGRAVGIGLLLLAVYQGLVSAHVVPASDGNSQLEDNLIRAQRYTCETTSVPTLALVGTSLTQNLKAEYFGPNVVNLGIAGGSVQTGLDLVLRAPRKPQTLLVEINDKITYPPDPKLLGAVTGPMADLACRDAPMLRVEYRPASVVVSVLKRWIKRRDGRSEEARDATETIDQSIRQQLIAQELAAQSAPLSSQDESAFRSAAQTVREKIARLQGEGVRVVLFAPPGEAAVQASLRQRQIRVLLHQMFPDNLYRWLPAPAPQPPWTTRDGVHLIRPDARRYAAFVRSHLP